MTSNVRITVLVENTAARRDLLGEHGLAFWIELGSRAVLFDTGQGIALGHNARRLGIDPARAEAVILSHGHYDHTGGLGEVLAGTTSCPVYAHLAALEPKFACSADGAARDIGIDADIARKLRDSGRFVPVERPARILDDLHVTGPVPRENDFEDTGGPFFADAECTRPDELADDQAVFLETPAGTMVILGCAHAGIINTLRYVRALTGGRPIHTVIGGTHLVSAGERRLAKTVEELRRLDVRRILPCHCTGFAAAARLWSELPGRCSACPAGTVLEAAT
ncbi:MAG: MBL fold metallo-hydrolase [Planctomycetes bacterium]|nr:MBL fold metallo-hydrolase [Planctomycetota bacterium]